MKLRIQDSSIRFRITLRELEVLGETGSLTCESHLPDGTSGTTVFRYEVRRDVSLQESLLLLNPFVISLALSDSDFQELSNPEKEGVYIRREWQDGEKTRRSIVFIEKDRPGSTCVKQEAWIYELNPGGTPTTMPIPGGARAEYP